MSIGIGALKDKVSKMQVERNRKKDSALVEDTFEVEDEVIERVGSKKEGLVVAK